MIVVKDLKKTYETKMKKGFLKAERKKVEAVRQLDMQLSPGKIVGLLGINGAGKTTSIKMLSTLLTPTAGTILVDGIDAVKRPMEVKRKINMVAGGERMIYWRLSGRENLWYFGQLYGIENKELSKRIESLMKLVGLEEKQDVPVENYSKGMKQRLQIARGLINNPDYMFLDEPTLGLDAVIARELRAHVRHIAEKEGKGILLTSHYMAEIEELCDYVYILDQGRVIAEGSPKELASLGVSSRTLHLELQGGTAKDLAIVRQACLLADNGAVIESDELGAIVITSMQDLRGIVARICVQHQLLIGKLYEEEPRLEDAIIKLSKGA